MLATLEWHVCALRAACCSSPASLPLALPQCAQTDGHSGVLQVGGLSIKYMLTKDAKWTKALKYM